MDLGPKELETMSIISVFKQTFNIIFSMKKIFTQITLAFIFPVSLLMICQMHDMESLYSNIHSNKMILNSTPSSDIAISKALTDLVVYQYIVLLLLCVLYLICVFILSISSSSAVAYTVGGIYVAADLKFTGVVRGVQSMWKKFLIKKSWKVLLYHLIHLSILYNYLLHVWFFTSNWGHRYAIFCVAATFTVSIVTPLNNFEWHLAGVASAFEDISVTQTRDNLYTLTGTEYRFICLTVVMLNLVTLVTEASYYLVVVHGSFLSHIHQAISGIVCSLLISQVILVGLVVQTFAYFLLKASNGVNIEKSHLPNILPSYLEEDVSQKVKSVPLKDCSAV